ncbi:LIM domain-binding protein 2 isoform X1, partial [Tachysurus ichikawai]
IGRTLIPRYFSTVFEGGVTDLYYILKHSKESFHNSCITVDCDQCTMVTQHGKPMFTKHEMFPSTQTRFTEEYKAAQPTST